MSPERAAFIADFEMVVENLRDVQARWLAACPQPDDDPRRGSYTMMLGVLRDELEPMLEAWKNGDQFSQKGEEIIVMARSRVD